MHNSVITQDVGITPSFSGRRLSTTGAIRIDPRLLGGAIRLLVDASKHIKGFNHKAAYTDIVPELTHLLELDHIHRANLACLESLAAKHGMMDVPLRVANEIQIEQAELAKVREEFNQLEGVYKKHKSFLKRRERIAAQEQLKNKKEQVETHDRNIAYLSSLAEKYGEDVPLNLHNAVREEAKQLIRVQQSISKLDWLLYQITCALNRVQRASFTMNPNFERRGKHRTLINKLQERRYKSASYGPYILEIIGDCAIEQGVLCIGALDGRTCVILLDTVSDLQLDFLSFTAAQTDKIPRLLNMPQTGTLFLQNFGDALLKLEMCFYSECVEVGPFDFEFLPSLDLVYLNVGQKVFGDAIENYRENLDSVIEERAQMKRTFKQISWKGVSQQDGVFAPGTLSLASVESVIPSPKSSETTDDNNPSAMVSPSSSTLPTKETAK